MGVGPAAQVERDGEDLFLSRDVRLLLGFQLPWQRMNTVFRFLATVSLGWLDPLLLFWTVRIPASDLQPAIACSCVF